MLHAFYTTRQDNFLFFGSDTRDEPAVADLMLLKTAKLNGINPRFAERLWNVPPDTIQRAFRKTKAITHKQTLLPE
ncbi:MAG: hypothetical protein JKY60_10285 [Kordiimonadaceae bacterium]|nr:hypothetical protein [Kordiimonadaceae bacterium]